MSPTGEHADLSVQNAGQTTSPPPQIPEAAHIDEGNQKSTPIETANAPPPPQKPSRRHSFAEEVVGYAKQIRGTVGPIHLVTGFPA
ncbi:hypothetical protein DAEQUDRAFT_732830 [Daedalea quercina L-15889]|uniref:Uncharacterized protein n=1 Tax=Daedalea quercina L-15889 TaxID=1314783 RepID=A0A165LDF3_9APHY|nr:hypothetical protein DAEQUDRAFT_732830 [Daedalea quercina L-15889]